MQGFRNFVSGITLPSGNPLVSGHGSHVASSSTGKYQGRVHVMQLLLWNAVAMKCCVRIKNVLPSGNLPLM